MAAITINNTDWTILDAVRAAVAGATVNSQAVFAAVAITASAEQARQCQQAGRMPSAIVRYVGTVEGTCGGGEGFAVVELELLLTARLARGVNEAAAVQEALRLINGAKNALMAAVPAAAKPVANETEFHEALEWGRPRIESEASDSPWVAATLPVRLAYPLASATGH
jgi:hypothetical protein